MAKEISKTQIDRLGDRIKRGAITEEDLRLLDRYRRSFSASYDVVVGDIRDKLGLEPTGRPAKSTTSIVDKLKRESIRLTQIQDIAGCRIIVADITKQDSVIKSLTGLLPQVAVIDRRVKPSHGYRAVHVVVDQGSKLIEIQVRTALQQLWAELSEKYSDVIDPSIKYGGNAKVQGILQKSSMLVAIQESEEKDLKDALASSLFKELSDEEQQAIDDEQKKLEWRREKLGEMFRNFINDMSKLKEGRK
jgi:ppGpp synthetase/RelA/SpoT-type nucleotidyltranferase